MAKNIDKGVELLEENGRDRHVRCERISRGVLRANVSKKGDEVTSDYEIISQYREHLEIETIEGVELVRHVTELGKRRVIAGVEKALLGMKKNGYREILVAPHLAYGVKGVSGPIPENALLRIKIWVRDVQNAS